MADNTGGEGSEPDRLVFLSDGVFAIAATLLVLDLSIPDGLDSAGFRDEVGGLGAEIGAYALSFVVISAYWREHREIFRHVKAVDETVTRLTLLGLGLVALLPFPTTLLAEYGSEPEAVAIYAATVAAVDIALATLHFVLSRRPHLLAERVEGRVARAMVLDLGSPALVFAASIPIAYVSPSWAKWFWLLLFPLMYVTGTRRRALDRRAAKG